MTRASSGVNYKSRLMDITVNITRNFHFSMTRNLDNRTPKWHGHLSGMREDRWSKKFLDWIPPDKIKRQRASKKWRCHVQRMVNERELNERDWIHPDFTNAQGPQKSIELKESSAKATTSSSLHKTSTCST